MSKPNKFVGLHAHSNRSIFDGFGSADEHLQFSVDNGLDAFCLTDHGTQNGLPEGYLKAQELNKSGRKMKFVAGCEFYYHPDLKAWARSKAERDQQRKEEREASKSKRPVTDEGDDPGVAVEDEEASKRIDKFMDPVNRRHHLVVLPKSRKGLENIFRLVSRSSREGYYRFPRIDAAMLKEHGEDLVVSTACIAGVPSWATYSQFAGKTFDELVPELLDEPGKRNDVMRAVGNEFDRLIDAVGRDNVFAEIQFNKLAPQHLTNRVLMEFAKSNGLKLVAAADSHYSSPDLWRAREVYKLLGRMGRGGQDINPDSVPSDVKQLKCELYPKNAEQMWDSYKEYCAGHDFYRDDVVSEAIENAWHVAHDVIGNVDVDTSVKLPSFGVTPGLTPFQTLVELCKDGMRAKLLGKNPAYLQRLKTELTVVQKLDNAIYFLTLKAILDVAKRETILGCGRGSGAGSLINYLLGITDVDPVKNKLIFARFMSLARAKNDLPDIDVDTSDRDHVIDMLKEEFGEKTIVPITNFNALQIKSLVKDVSKLHGVPYEEINDVTRNLDSEVKPHLTTGDETKGAIQLTYEACVEHSPAFKAFVRKHPAVGEDVRIIGRQPKALGKHAGGVIVHDDPDGIMPLISVRGEIQSPWSEGMNTKGLSPFGIIKYDLLGLDTLRMFERCIRRVLKRHEGVAEPTFQQVRDWYNQHLSPSVIDPADPNVFKRVFREGRFAGVFQFTNPATQKFVQDLDPSSVTDLAAATAIYRPGPLAAHVDKEYVKAKREGKTKDYGHPIVNEVLKDTLGFMIFQEQIQQISIALAGFSDDDADRLRKAILKRTVKDVAKGKSLTDELHDKFIEGAVKNDYSKHKAEALYEDMRAFSAYAFNLAHSVSYGFISYQCAWLMTYYEPEWLCSYVESMLGNPDSRARAMSEIKSMGYDIAKVDINRSGHDWEIATDGRTFYPSFHTIKGLGKTAVDEILLKRPYGKLEDLLWNDDASWKHSKLNKKSLDALVKIGAFDSMSLVGPGRTFDSYRQMYHVVIDGQDDLKKRLKREPERHLRRLAELIDEAKTLPDWDRTDKLQAQFDLSGSVEIESLLEESVRATLSSHDIAPIDECVDDGGVHWFVLISAERKLARKSNKPYLQLSVYGADGNARRVFVWGSGETSAGSLVKYGCYVAHVKRDSVGFSTNMRDLRQLS